MFDFEKFLNIGLNEDQVKAMKGVHDNLTAKSGEKTLTDILDDLKKFNNVEPIVEDASASTIIKKSNGFISMINEADDEDDEDDEDEDMEDFEESDEESDEESEPMSDEESEPISDEESEPSDMESEPMSDEVSEPSDMESEPMSDEESDDVLEPMSDEESEPSDMESEPMSDEESEPMSDEVSEPSDMESELMSDEVSEPSDMESEPDGDETQGGVADGSHSEPDGDEVSEPNIPTEQNSNYNQGYLNGVFDRGFEIGYEAGFNDKGYYNAVVSEGDESFNDFLKQLKLFEEASSPEESNKKVVAKPEVKPMTPKTVVKPEVKVAPKKEPNKEIKNEVKPIKPIAKVGEKKVENKPEVKKEVANESFYNAVKGQGSEQYKNTIDNLFKGYNPNLNKKGTPEQMKIQEELKATRRQLIVEQYLNSISPLKRSKMKAIVESLANKISNPEDLREALILLPVDSEPKQKINENVTPINSSTDLNENNKYNSKEEEKIVANTLDIFSHLGITQNKDKGKK